MTVAWVSTHMLPMPMLAPAHSHGGRPPIETPIENEFLLQSMST